MLAKSMNSSTKEFDSLKLYICSGMRMKLTYNIIESDIINEDIQHMDTATL